MPLPSDDLAVLSEPECRELLGSVEIGRVVTSFNALPSAFPVNFRLVGNEIVFRTGTGAKLTAALNETVVAFEVDNADRAAGEAWSVLVVGHSAVVTDPERIAAFDRLDIRSWAGKALPYYVAITLDRISGRRVPGPSADRSEEPAAEGSSGISA